jgi:hypothetical protein
VHFDFGNTSGAGPANFWAYEGHQFEDGYMIDVWPDPVSKDAYPSQMKEDRIVGAAAMRDGSVWFASNLWGLAHMSPDGSEGFVTSGLIDVHLTAIARDTGNDSIWAGGWGGISRLEGGSFSYFGMSELGPNLLGGPISDIQAAGSGADRKMVVGFTGGGSVPDAVGIYSGN